MKSMTPRPDLEGLPPDRLLDLLEERARTRRSVAELRLKSQLAVVASPTRWATAFPLSTCGAAFAGAAVLASGDGRRSSPEPSEESDSGADGVAAAGVGSALFALAARAASTWLVQQVSGPDDAAPTGEDSA